MSELSHLDKGGNVKQVSVGHKPVVERRAEAAGFIRLSGEVLEKIEKNRVAKGNVLAVARIAGIQAAKKTAELIPLCHPILLEHVEMSFDIQSNGIGVRAIAAASAKTGVEMEALTAVHVALLTIYDMCKAIDKKMRMESIRLIRKTKGGTRADLRDTHD